MKKIFGTILLFVFLFLSFGGIVQADVTQVGNDVKIFQQGAKTDSNIHNDKLENFDENTTGFIGVTTGGEKGIYNTLIQFAKNLKNLFYAIATIFFLVIILKLIFSGNTEEELGKFKKGIVWITIGLIMMQLAFAFTEVLFDRGVSAQLGVNLMKAIVEPLILLIQTLASIFFIAMAILAFYRLTTANGNEEAIKTGKMTILYSLMGIFIIKLAREIVEAFYGKIESCSNVGVFLTNPTAICNQVDITKGTQIIISILNWINGFMALAVVIMIIYAGIQILLSAGDEEKIKKGKTSMMYIAIGLGILALNYLILTFFLIPDGTI